MEIDEIQASKFKTATTKYIGHTCLKTIFEVFFFFFKVNMPISGPSVGVS